VDETPTRNASAPSSRLVDTRRQPYEPREREGKAYRRVVISCLGPGERDFVTMHF
jgi:hypothetical protein